MSSLQYLYLYDNVLTGAIPENLKNLTSLYHLYLQENELTGTIPTWLDDLTSLNVLDLGDNRLTVRSRPSWAASPVSARCGSTAMA